MFGTVYGCLVFLPGLRHIGSRWVASLIVLLQRIAHRIIQTSPGYRSQRNGFAQPARKQRTLLTLAETKLIKETQHKLSVLKDMIRINVLDGVVSSMDVGVAVLESSFEDERSREAVPCSRAVVRASVSAGTVDACNIGILTHLLNSVLISRENCMLTSSMTRAT